MAKATIKTTKAEKQQSVAAEKKETPAEVKAAAFVEKKNSETKPAKAKPEKVETGIVPNPNPAPVKLAKAVELNADGTPKMGKLEKVRHLRALGHSRESILNDHKDDWGNPFHKTTVAIQCSVVEKAKIASATTDEEKAKWATVRKDRVVDPAKVAERDEKKAAKEKEKAEKKAAKVTAKAVKAAAKAAEPAEISKAAAKAEKEAEKEKAKAEKAAAKEVEKLEKKAAKESAKATAAKEKAETAGGAKAE